jgi:hypothetical protein
MILSLDNCATEIGGATSSSSSMTSCSVNKALLISLVCNKVGGGEKEVWCQGGIDRLTWSDLRRYHSVMYHEDITGISQRKSTAKPLVRGLETDSDRT